MDDLCSTCRTVAVRVCERLRNGRINTYFTSPGSDCACSWSLSETITAANDLWILKSLVSFSNGCNLMIANLQTGGWKVLGR